MRRIALAALLCACGGASQSKVRQLGGLLDIQPAYVDFGDVALGKEATLQVTLQNDGLVPLSVAELSQFQDVAFEVKGLPVTLTPGQKAAVSVRYRPPALGAHANSLELVTDAPGAGRADVGLHGNAVRGLATLSGDTFDFGDVVLNETATQSFSLSNNDGHALTSVRIDQPLGGDAAFSVAPPGDQPLGPEQSMAVTVQFHPTRLGDFAATVAVTPCPTCSPRNVQLTGHGVTRLVDLQPADIDFGLVLLGASAEKPISLRNTSKSPLVIQTPMLTGSPEITVALDGLSYPATLSPGQTVTGVARFRPRTLGEAVAQVTITASDGGPGTLALHGTGYGPVLQPTPKSLFIGSTALGTTRSGNLQITNVGTDPNSTAPLRVTGLSLQSQDAAWHVDTTAPVNVGEPGSSGTVTVSFQPQREGPSQAVLVIESNDGLNPQIQVPLLASGRALQPCALSVIPQDALVDFGPTPLHQATVQGFELTNVTNPADDCVVGEPQLTGASAFRWPGGVVPSSRTLPPGGRMSVRVEFDPDQAQTYNAAVSFYMSNPVTPSMSVKLTGTGDDACFFLSPSTADFGATTLGCTNPQQNVYAVNHCAWTVRVNGAQTAAPFSTSFAGPVDVAPQTSLPIPVRYQPATIGDDVGTLYVSTSENPRPLQAGLTGGAQTTATVFDQWDQSTPKVDMLIVIDNSGSMLEEQKALGSNLDHLWNRIALANADFHIAVTTTGMEPYTSGWTQCPGGANGGEGGRFFPVDNSHPRLLTPQTPDVKSALFQNTAVGQCHWKEQFTEPVVAALTDPLISSAKAPGTPWPSDGNLGFLRDDARLALMAVSDSDDDIDLAQPPPVSYLIDQLRNVKHGALDLVSFAGIIPMTNCATVEGIGTRYMEIARQLHGQVFDICNLNNMGAMLDSALGALLQPLSSFPLSAHPRDPGAIVVTVNGAVTTTWSYDATSNRIVFPSTAIPAPGSHITAKYEPACQ